MQRHGGVSELLEVDEADGCVGHQNVIQREVTVLALGRDTPEGIEAVRKTADAVNEGAWPADREIDGGIQLSAQFISGPARDPPVVVLRDCSLKGGKKRRAASSQSTPRLRRGETVSKVEPGNARQSTLDVHVLTSAPFGA